MTLEKTHAILNGFYRSNSGAILVERIPIETYPIVVQEISEIFQRREQPMCRDFLEMIAKDHDALFDEMLKARNVRNWFVYNLDLFGRDVDPNLATEVMNMMRASKNMYPETRQLMIARPEANLDYNSRKGFGFNSNHPLGNWCQFYRLSGDILVQDSTPIKHRSEVK